MQHDIPLPNEHNHSISDQTTQDVNSTTTPLPAPDRTILIGLSGPSSSGKTTLARLLRQIFTSTSTYTSASPPTPILSFLILHEDDFYKTDALIPQREFSSPEHGTRVLADWDCVESLDLPLMKRVLTHVKAHGRVPPEFTSMEDLNAVGESGVEDEVVEAMNAEVGEWMDSTLRARGNGTRREVDTNANSESGHLTICLFDGFLLYPDPSSPTGSPERELCDILDPLLDLKIFLPSTRRRTIDRRTKRTGYVTLEGFWEDPPGFVEDLVWPNYRRYHAWMFGADRGSDGKAKGEDLDEQDGDLVRAIDEGRVNAEIVRREGMVVGPGAGEVHLREIVPWAVRQVVSVASR